MKNRVGLIFALLIGIPLGILLYGDGHPITGLAIAGILGVVAALYDTRNLGK